MFFSNAKKPNISKHDFLEKKIQLKSYAKQNKYLEFAHDECPKRSDIFIQRKAKLNSICFSTAKTMTSRAVFYKMIPFCNIVSRRGEINK